MKKLFTFTLAAISLFAVSCNKDITVEISDKVSKTFTVSSPATKTELSGLSSVVWSEGDKITVIAKTSGNSYTFDLKSGAGSTKAAFTGEINVSDENETEFYAFYPASVALDLTDKNNPLSAGYLTVKSALPQNIPAVLNGFNSAHAMMTAVSDDSGNFAFRYGTAFLKIKIGVPDVKSLTVDMSAGSARPGGRPSFNVNTGATENVQSALKDVTLVASDSFVKDGVYYIPVQTKQSNVKTLKLVYTLTDGVTSAVISTESLSSVKLQNGIVYDLGCPPVAIAPSIQSEDVAIDANVTSGTIEYKVLCPAESGTLTAALSEASEWLSVGAIAADAVAFTCSANTSSDERSATVVLTYTYGDKSVNKQIVVTQRGAGTVAAHYVWDFSSSEWVSAFKTNFTAINNNEKVSFSVDGLDVIGVNTLKYNVVGELYYIQMGGKGKTTERAFHFTAPEAGTLSVWATNTGDSDDLTRTVDVKVGSAAAQSQAGGYAKKDGPHQLDFSVNAGEVYVYGAVNGLCFYKLEFQGN